MRTKLTITTMLVLPMLFSASAIAAEKGFTHASSGGVVRTGFGECWRSPYKDAGKAVDMACLGDADGDGVADGMDQCPDTPKGTKVDARGCPMDSDGDGIADANDKCPNTPPMAKVDANGCPLDSDGDGIADFADHCPGTPAGARVNDMGCTTGIVLQGVLFATNSDQLTEGAKMTLDKVAASLNARADVKSVKIAGHTDSMGAAAYNQDLSERRAKAVAGYLQSQGVSGDRISAMGMGETSPAADNGTAEGRAANRRVELTVN